MALYPCATIGFSPFYPEHRASNAYQTPRFKGAELGILRPIPFLYLLVVVEYMAFLLFPHLAYLYMLMPPEGDGVVVVRMASPVRPNAKGTASVLYVRFSVRRSILYLSNK